MPLGLVVICPAGYVHVREWLEVVSNTDVRSPFVIARCEFP